MYWIISPLNNACPEWQKALAKFVATGDLDKALSDHLDACPTCTAAVDAIHALQGKKKP